MIFLWSTTSGPHTVALTTLQNGQRFLQAWKTLPIMRSRPDTLICYKSWWKPSRTTNTASISLCKFPPATFQHAKTLENQVPSISFCRLAIRSSRVSTCANHKNRPDPSWPSPADHFSGSLAVHSSVSFARYLEIWNHEASMNRSILFHINIRIPHEVSELIVQSILACGSNHEVQWRGVFPLLEFTILLLDDRKEKRYIQYHSFGMYIWSYMSITNIHPIFTSSKVAFHHPPLHRMVRLPFARLADWTAHSVTASNCCLAEAVSDLRQNQHAQHV